MCNQKFVWGPDSIRGKLLKGFYICPAKMKLNKGFGQV